MHILAIHMNTMHLDLSEDWDFLTANFAELRRETDQEQGKRHSSGGSQNWMVAKKNNNQVPLLLQDSITRMLHFILSLPVNIDKGLSSVIDFQFRYGVKLRDYSLLRHHHPSVFQLAYGANIPAAHVWSFKTGERQAEAGVLHQSSREHLGVQSRTRCHRHGKDKFLQRRV
jgi:hypothetical protein